MAQEKPGMMVYFKLADAIRNMSYEEKGRLFGAMLDYAQYGALPTFDGFPLLDALWSFVQGDLDMDDRRYQKKAHDSYIKGLTNAFKTFYAPQNGIDPNDKAALQRYIAEREAEDRAEREAENSKAQISADSRGKAQISNISSNSSSSISSSSNSSKGIMINDKRDRGCAVPGAQASETEEMAWEDKRREGLARLDAYDKRTAL